MTWFLNNIGTIAVLLILAAIVTFIVIHLKKEKSAGKSSCGCNCAGCALHGKCHSGKKA